MSQGLHRILGVLVLVAYILMLSNLQNIIPSLAVAYNTGGKAGGGALNVLLLPIASIVCFLWGPFLSRKFSPRGPVLGDRVLPDSFYYLVGYLLLGAFALCFLLFRSL